MELELRIALLIVGLAVIVALYFFSRSKRAAYKREDDEFNFESDALPDPLELDQPLQLSDDLQQDYDQENNRFSEELNDISNLVREDIAESPRIKLPKDKPSFKHQPSLLDEKPEPSKSKEKLVILHVMAKRPQKFNGKTIMNLCNDFDLELNDMNIFNKNVERFSGKRALYSVVNMVKPGTFDADGMHEFSTPGLSFILNLPGPEEGLRAFNIMLEDARKFSERLNGDLLDESRNRLNPQMTAHLQEDIQLFSLRYPRSAPA
jgi:cell division protein ZipA